VRSLIYSATYVLTPTASELDARGETRKLHELLVAGAKYSVLMSWPVLFGMMIFGENFLATWVGESYRSAFPLLLTLTVPTLLSLPQATAGALLFGVSRHKGVVALSLANALVNLGLSIALARPLGLLGVALGTALPLALISGLATMVYACHALELPLGTYLWQGLGRPALLTATFVVPALALRMTWNPTGWVPLAVACSSCWALFAVCAWRFGATPSERERWRRMLPGVFRRGDEATAAPHAIEVAAGLHQPRRGEPRVSVLLTAYNAAWCIERALDSVFAQTRLPDEVVVSDDGSTDDTAALVEKKYGDRVRLLRLPHQGLTPSRRAAFAAATGDWLAVLDADDWWQPTKLERQVQFLARHPEVKWISTDGEYVAAEGVVRSSWLSDYFRPVRDRVGDLLPALVERCFPLVSSTLIERGAYEASGGFDPAFTYSQDYDLWLRLAARHPGAVIGEPLIAYWSSPGQLSRRIEARYLDDLALMQRIARGELRLDPILQRRGRVRAAELEYDLALLCLRTGRGAEARERFARAAADGSWLRRAMAFAGSALPTNVTGGLARFPLLGRAVSAARRTVAPAWDASTNGDEA
jgi:hypothetical protein